MVGSEKLPWKRLIVEAAAIVGSILLAFAIDAWWDERQERQEERQYLVTLKRDFEQTRNSLEESLQVNRQASESVLELLEIVQEPKNSVAETELVRHLFDVFRAHYPTAVFGTFHDMVNSGDLRLIQSGELRLNLAQFESDWTGFENNTLKEVFEQWNLIQVPFLISHLDVTSVYANGYRGVTFPGNPKPIDRDQIWTQEFANLLAIAIIADLDIVRGGESLLDSVTEIPRLIDQSQLST